MVDPKHRIVQLGNLVIHKVVKKQIPIVNHSQAPITITLTNHPITQQLQHTNVLRISPTQPITLPANGGQAKVDVVFAPKSRIPTFSEEVSGKFRNLSPLSYP